MGLAAALSPRWLVAHGRAHSCVSEYRSIYPKKKPNLSTSNPTVFSPSLLILISVCKHSPSPSLSPHPVSFPLKGRENVEVMKGLIKNCKPFFTLRFM